MDKFEPYSKELSDICDSFDQQISELAERVRTEVIVPICKQHNLEFTSGMGTFFFSVAGKDRYEDERYGDARDLKGKWKRILGPVLELLDSEVTRSQYLGYYVSDVRKGTDT